MVHTQCESAEPKLENNAEEKPLLRLKNTFSWHKNSQDYQAVSYFQLYKFATNFDKLLLAVATLLCTISSICNALICYTYGEATGAIIDYVYVQDNGNVTEVDETRLMNVLNWYLVTGCGMGVVVLIFVYISTLIFSYCALRQTHIIREKFLTKILDQDIPWFDVNQTGDFASRMTDDLKKIEDGIGEKVPTFLFSAVALISSVMQGFILGWELALICMVSFPVYSILIALVTYVSTKLAKNEMTAYGNAGTVAEETLTAIRTVIAFDGQAKEEERYNNKLKSARDNNIKRYLLNGVSTGIMWLFFYLCYSLSFWYGVKLVLADRELPPEHVQYNNGKMIGVFFSILTGTWMFSATYPLFQVFGIAKGAASKIFTIIESKSLINASKDRGIKTEGIAGNVEFKNVDFCYPSRPGVKVLQGFTLKIHSGQKIALVGKSGCGKSTCVNLIQRFYDPTSGCVTVDGTDIAKMNLSWLRSRISVVGQEPVLFDTTIADNIKLGWNSATMDDVINFAKIANAHDFIKSLPNGYKTVIGERGTQLSGGQKQRVAIARALVRNPAILLLDEATSALNTKSESIVQEALDQVSYERTSIVVAHRLSTIRKVDKIVVISNGSVVEEGSHEELMSLTGEYYALVTSQNFIDDCDNKSTTLENNKLSGGTLTKVDESSVHLVLNLSQEDEDVQVRTSVLWDILALNSPEWWIIVIGCVSSIITGGSYPFNSIFFGDIVGVLSNNNSDYVQNQTNNYSLYFLYLGIITLFSSFLQIYMFGVAGEKLTMRFRKRMFKAFLSQEVAWFDNKNNGVGALCARLSLEAVNVQRATGQCIGGVLNAFSSVIIAIAISFCFEWRVTLVSLSLLPILIFSVVMEQKIIAKDSEGHHKSLENSTKIAVEAIGNIRTIASLGSETAFREMYMNALIPYQSISKKNVQFRGIVYAVSRSILFFGFAITLYYGALLIKSNVADSIAVFVVNDSMFGIGWSLSIAMTYTPNFEKGLQAASRILTTLRRVPKVQSGSITSNEVVDVISYKNVHFSYPTRPTVPILNDLNLSILRGKMVALVGASGCGKSTVINLLERFYDCNSGKISLGNKGINIYNLTTLRSCMGVVSQEPNLFSRTIAENIAYGDNRRTVTRQEILEAAAKANIHDFVRSLPLGYDTELGEKGTQLSGGQKQRIAIARALIRNPTALLLDEATSALDAESEKVVQEALDKAKVGRTCITIAHRLSTIKNADVIYVLNEGRVAEMGTHHELLRLKGIYFNMYTLQN